MISILELQAVIRLAHAQLSSAKNSGPLTPVQTTQINMAMMALRDVATYVQDSEGAAEPAEEASVDD